MKAGPHLEGTEVHDTLWELLISYFSYYFLITFLNEKAIKKFADGFLVVLLGSKRKILITKRINYGPIPTLTSHWMEEMTTCTSSLLQKCRPFHFVSPQALRVLKSWLCLRGSKWHEDTSIHRSLRKELVSAGKGNNQEEREKFIYI